ncbi:MAG: hypothetical protein LUC90_02705 [Lachnospiraceae bacterium]|nr:hypothetical protein [Lachnospiraceae bacterium]
MALEKWNMLRCHPNPCGWLLLTAKHILSKTKRSAALCTEAFDMENMIYEEPAYELLLMEDLLHSLYGETDEKLARGYFLDGSSVAELSEDMQMSRGGVRTRLYRIRKKLREEAR